jgi:hypothetical protein
MKYVNIIRDALGRHPAWPLPSSVAVGDFGDKESGAFVRMGRLIDYGLVPEIIESSPTDRSVYRTGSIHVAAAGGALELEARVLSSAFASGAISLQGESGALVVVSAAKETSLTNLGRLKSDLGIIKKRANLGLSTCIVRSVLSVQQGTIVFFERGHHDVGAAVRSAGLDVSVRLEVADVTAFFVEGIRGPFAFDLDRCRFLLGRVYSDESDEISVEAESPFADSGTL